MIDAPDEQHEKKEEDSRVDDSQYAAPLATASTAGRDPLIQQYQQALHGWRKWAQFVYMGGGPLTDVDDAERQRLVCEAHDKERGELVHEREIEVERACQIADKLFAAEAEVEHQRGHKEDYAAMLERSEAALTALRQGVAQAIEDARTKAEYRKQMSREANHNGNKELDAYHDGMSMGFKEMAYALSSLLSSLKQQAAR